MALLPCVEDYAAASSFSAAIMPSYVLRRIGKVEKGYELMVSADGFSQTDASWHRHEVLLILFSAIPLLAPVIGSGHVLVRHGYLKGTITFCVLHYV